MRKPTALLIPSPWSGDQSDPIPLTYPAWFWLYKTTRNLRHRAGLHDYDRIWPVGGQTFRRCSWCGNRRATNTGSSLREER